MNELQKMMLRLTPVADHIKSQVGDSFNLEHLAKMLVTIENINGISPQMKQAMQYANYIPVNNNISAVVGTSHELVRKQGIGRGKEHTGTGMDIPLVETTYDKISLGTKMGAIGYQYSIAEIATALAMGINLESDKVASARLGFERHMSDVAWIGEESTGLKGFYNQDGVALTAKNIDFKTASVQEIMDLINTMIYDSMDASEFDDSVMSDTILLPVAVARDLSGRTVSATNETPLLDYIRKNNEAKLEGYDITITSNRKGNGIGNDNSDRIVAYRKDPNCIEMRIPQELEFLTAQAKGLDVFVPAHYIYQGVWLKRVDSMRYLDVKK